MTKAVNEIIAWAANDTMFENNAEQTAVSFIHMSHFIMFKVVGDHSYILPVGLLI